MFAQQIPPKLAGIWGFHALTLTLREGRRTLLRKFPLQSLMSLSFSRWAPSPGLGREAQVSQDRMASCEIMSRAVELPQPHLCGGVGDGESGTSSLASASDEMTSRLLILTDCDSCSRHFYVLATLDMLRYEGRTGAQRGSVLACELARVRDRVTPNSDSPSVTRVPWHGHWGHSNMGRLRVDLSPPHWGWPHGFENRGARERAASFGCQTKGQEQGGVGCSVCPRTPLKPEDTHTLLMLSEV